jgi:hypothetical protein
MNFALEMAVNAKYVHICDGYSVLSCRQLARVVFTENVTKYSGILRNTPPWPTADMIATAWNLQYTLVESNIGRLAAYIRL